MCRSQPGGYLFYSADFTQNQIVNPPGGRYLFFAFLAFFDFFAFFAFCFNSTYIWTCYPRSSFANLELIVSYCFALWAIDNYFFRTILFPFKYKHFVLLSPLVK
jgi:hypothetical protein